jgi:hypothetical protein
LSFIKLPQDSFDTFTVLARPSRSFASSSVDGITGDVRVFKRLSRAEKDSSVFNDSLFTEDSIESAFLDVKSNASQSANFSKELEKYIEKVNSSPIDPRFQKSVEVIRFEPSFRLTSDTLRKNVVRTVLLPHYKIGYPNIGWGYTNYCSLHFPKDVGPTSASIIYPNPKEGNLPVYSPEQDFTIEFYVKPSYVEQNYSAGTILHMSSCFAISIVSGSDIDFAGEPSSFRVLLQLTHSADLNPKYLDLNSIGSNPLEYAFLSDDFKIKRNNWHHVCLTWSPTKNESTGSFYIDGNKAGSFYCPENLLPFSASYDDRSAIFVGNFYDGENNFIYGPHGFFSLDAVNNEGVTDAFNATPSNPEYPSNFKLDAPFKGELHEIRIWNISRDWESITSGSKIGPDLDENLLFYVPPFFRKETSERLVLQTPFQSFASTTDDPYNVALSFGVGGHHINVENHTRELVKGYYPRLLFLTSSEIPYQSQDFKEANDYFYATGSTVRRNLTIMPCDNGKFYPNFQLLYSGTDSDYEIGKIMEKFVTDTGAPDLSFVNLSKLLPTSSLFPGLVQDGNLLDELMGTSPENPGVAPGAVLTIFQRTRDESSNAVTFFDASNLFYGSRIYPETYEVIDNSFTGSEGTMSIRLRDNGLGSLYRADADSTHATWASSGFILYSEGISVVTTPYLGELFGKDSYTVNLRGTQPVHVLEIQTIVPAWQINSSSNPDWKQLYLTDYVNDTQAGFIRIGRINFHDQNLNIVARTDLAQPINKRNSDRIMFRTKIDF